MVDDDRRASRFVAAAASRATIDRFLAKTLRRAIVGARERGAVELTGGPAIRAALFRGPPIMAA
ncbi:hypothetical protein [Nannocystis punicea]|uniref:Uncharacterized protein n=1 Tax=Nannocystis punicea TaxID=2995304 RepID=A0ABY7H6Y7_9BACT|nr:hypothetical protein [Nannocystis poenicansa]WAS94847.1 hypothetical protein O0S08_01690 [Nannocystis poenicansa]